MAKDLIRSFRKLMTTTNKKPSSYTTKAEVVRVSGDTAWVHIDGGVDQTPANMGVACKKGDVVTVRIANKTATVSGNMTAPPTDDTKVDILTERIAEGDFRGEQGEDGADGKDAPDIVKIVTEHCLANANAIPEGETFDDIQYTDWSETLPTMVSGKYFWKRTITYLSDETVIYGEPVFDIEAQLSYEASAAATAAESAASEAQAAAQTASDEASDAADAAAAAADDADIVKAQEKHFWFDANTGAHISTAEKSINTGGAVNATNSAVTFTKDAKMLASLSVNALNFYDGTANSASADDLLSSYSKSGTTFYAKQTGAAKAIRTTSFTNSAVTFWDPTDSGNDQKKLAIFAKNSAQFYHVDGNSNGIMTSWSKGALNFYDGSSASASADDLLAAYSKNGLVLYGKADTAGATAKRIASFTRSGASFWDPSDGTTALATFGASGISFNTETPFTIGNPSGSYIKWYKNTSTNVWSIDINAGNITLGSNSVATQTDLNAKTAYLNSVTNDGLFVHRSGESGKSGTSPSDSTAYGVHITDSLHLIRAGKRIASFGNDGLGTQGLIQFYDPTDNTKRPGWIGFYTDDGDNYLSLGSIKLEAKKFSAVNFKSGDDTSDNRFGITVSHGTTNNDIEDMTMNVYPNAVLIGHTTASSSAADYYLRLKEGLLKLGATTSSGATDNFVVDSSTGNITVGGHSSPIGSNESISRTTNISTSNKTAKNVLSITLQPGVWLISCGVRFDSDNTGARRANLSTSSATTDIQVQVRAAGTASDPAVTQLVFTRIAKPTTETTYYLNAWQDSGGSLNVLGTSDSGQSGTYIYALRIL